MALDRALLVQGANDMGWKAATARRDPALIRIGAAMLALLVCVGSRGRPEGVTSVAPGLAPAVGTVSGMVRLTAPAASRQTMLSPYARPRYRPPARNENSSSSPENVVVYLHGPAPITAGARPPARIIQRNRTIIPHVTVVQTGTRVDFPNEDDVFHNIFSLSGPKRFNLGRYPPGESRSEMFAKAGVVRLFCDIHSEMGGVILVVDTPYFTQPDAQGRFRIADVPEGEYTAVVWHEVAGVDSTRVVITAGSEAKLDFSLGG
jgi:hypothetical protein